MEFYDSAVWNTVPGGGGPIDVALYHDGIYAKYQGRALVHADKRRWITITGDYRDCGIVDWEPGNPVFTGAGLRGFVRGRQGMGFRARVYCDRSHAREALDDLGYQPAALAWEHQPALVQHAEWWIATLDGVKLTAAELAGDLAQRWDAPIPAGRLWAQQWKGGQSAEWDESVLFGEW